MSEAVPRPAVAACRKHGSLALILVAAFLARFYRLETPSLWYDEMLLPQTVAYPFSYFMTWLTTLEVHPPYPYFLVRLVMLCGTSDFALRLPFALAGLVGVWALFAVGNGLFSRRVGLLCAALMAINPLDVYVSRVVRPYAFVILCAAGALYFLVRFLRTGQARFVMLAATADGAMLLFHYDAVFMTATTGATLSVAALRRHGPGNWEDVRRFCLWFGLFSLPTIYFLAKAVIFRGGASGLAAPGAIVQQFFVKSLPGLLDFYPSYPLFSWIFLALLVPGLVIVLRDRDLGLVAACTVLIPLAMLLILRHGYSLSTWHISYMLPLAVLAMALGGDFLAARRDRLAVSGALALAALAVYAYPVTLHRYFYEENSNGGYYKTFARVLPGFVRRGEATMLDPMDFHGTNWYLDRFTAQNPLRSQQGGDGRNVTLNVVTDSSGRLGHFSKEPDDLVRALGAPVAGISFPGARAWKFTLAPRPTPTLAGPGSSVSLGAQPQEFYPDVRDFHDVFISPYWGGLVTPVNNEQWGGFDYVIDNTAPAPQKIQAAIRYASEGRDNVLRVIALFDDEPETVVLDVHEPMSGEKEGALPQYPWQVNRYRPFSRLTLRVLLWAGLTTPGYDGGNLAKIGFKGLTLTTMPLGRDFFTPETLPFGCAVENIQDALSQDNPPARWRWAFGPSATVILELPADGEVAFTFAFCNPIAGQVVALDANGERVWTGKNLPAQPWMRENTEKTVTFHGRKGKNRLEFDFSHWNGSPAYFNDKDRMPYAVAFTRMEYHVSY